MLTRKRLGTLTAVACVALSGLLYVAGCGSGSTASKAPKWIQTQVFFGASVPGGAAVTSEQFSQFLDTVVTREFPKGITVMDAYGQMQRENGDITKQGTKVVLLVHEDTKANTEAVRRIVDEYRKLYGNAQVMKTTQPIGVDFFNN